MQLEGAQAPTSSASPGDLTAAVSRLQLQIDGSIARLSEGLEAIHQQFAFDLQQFRLDLADLSSRVDAWEDENEGAEEEIPDGDAYSTPAARRPSSCHEGR